MEFTKDIEFNTSPTAEQELMVNYSGFLSNSSELVIVYGFGEAWNHTTETPMTKTSSGFSAKINVLNFDTFNFCFRNSNYEWDNNDNGNYISPILPCIASSAESNAQEFDIDNLIEELLEPIMFKTVQEENTPVQISLQPIDLGLEISNALSQISIETVPDNLVEYNTLDEILAGTVIEETPIELLENDPKELLFQALEENLTETISEFYEHKSEDISAIENREQTALVNAEDSFMMISSRQLSKFYRFRKRIKLAFYKALVKLPKLIFGSEEQ